MMKFILVYVPLYAVQGILIPFFGIWLEQRGVDRGIIAALLSSLFLCKLVSNPLAAHVADLSGHTARIATVLCTSVAVCYAMLLIRLPVWAVCCIVVAASLCTGPLFPLTDRLALMAGQRFGWKRVWGSIGFGAGTLLAAVLIHLGKSDALMLLVVAGSVVAAGGLFRFDVSREQRAEKGHAPLRLLANLEASTLSIIAAAALTQSSNGYLYTLAGIHWKSLGLSSADVALLWTTGLAAEVAAFLLTPVAIAYIKPELIIALSGLLSAARWAILGAGTSMLPLIAGQLLQAATVGANVAALGAFVAQRVPERLQSTAMAAYMTLAMGVLITAASSLATLVEHSWHVNGFFVMVPFAGTAAVLAALSSRLDHIRPTRKEAP